MKFDKCMLVITCCTDIPRRALLLFDRCQAFLNLSLIETVHTLETFILLIILTVGWCMLNKSIGNHLLAFKKQVGV